MSGFLAVISPKITVTPLRVTDLIIYFSLRVCCILHGPLGDGGITKLVKKYIQWVSIRLGMVA